MTDIIKSIFQKSKNEIDVRKGFTLQTRILKGFLEVGVFITCVILIYYKQISLTFFISMTYYVYRYMWLIENFNNLTQTYQKLVVSLGRVNEILENKLSEDEQFGTKEITGAHVELLILKQDEKTCECLVGNAKVVKLGTVVSFGNGELKAKCIEVKDEGIRIFELIYEGIFLEILDKLGHVPLPPYIKEKLEDKDRYNTVYAKIEGSAAAPTAGLHFTDDIFNKLKEKNIEVLDVTLHVGLGTFRPVSEDNVLNHKMHSEFYMMDKEVALKLHVY